MRHLMKIVEGLTEAPISDLTIVGDPNKATSFSSMDSIKMQKPDFRPRMFKAFSRTPYNFEVYIINSNLVNADDEKYNDDVDDYATKLKAGFHKEFKFLGQNYIGQAGKIKVLLLSNLSPMYDHLGTAKIGLTPWILAHKIGHSFQDGLGDTDTNWGNSKFGRLVSDINITCHNIGLSQQGGHNGEEYKIGDGEYQTEFGGPYSYYIPMTTASARNSRLHNEFEIFPEMIAQFLITGKVTLKLPTSIASDQLEARLNAQIKILFDNLDGYILVEV